MESKKGKYKFLEHTADAKFQAFGKNLGEAFVNAALAMVSIMADPEKVSCKITKDITVEGNDREALLYSWLEEIVFLLDSEQFILGKIKKIKLQKKQNKFILAAQICGDKVSKKYSMHGDVKAVTYNEMKIEEKKGKALVQVVVDI